MIMKTTQMHRMNPTNDLFGLKFRRSNSEIIIINLGIIGNLQWDQNFNSRNIILRRSSLSGW